MKERILIVEDEYIVQLDLQSRLQQMGYTVVGLVSTGEEAVAKAAELNPDLVLMDVRLEGTMDGIEAAHRITAARSVPVLFLTAYAPTVSGQGQSDLRPCLSKPFRATELRNAIAHALDDQGKQVSSGI